MQDKLDAPEDCGSYALPLPRCGRPSAAHLVHLDHRSEALLSPVIEGPSGRIIDRPFTIGIIYCGVCAYLCVGLFERKRERVFV